MIKFIMRGQPQDRRALGKVFPTGIVRLHHIKEIFQWLTIKHVNGLAHHVRIGIQRQRGINHTRRILRNKILLDSAAGTTDTYRIQWFVIERDKLFFKPTRGVFRKPDVVMIAGLVCGGKNHGIPTGKLIFAALHNGSAGDFPLATANANAASELVNQPAIPITGIGFFCGFTITAQRRDGIEKAIDGAGFHPHHELGGFTIDGNPIDISFRILERIKIAVNGAAIEIGNRSFMTAIAAVTDHLVRFLTLFIERKHRNTFTAVVVHQRLQSCYGIFTAKKRIR